MKECSGYELWETRFDFGCFIIGDYCYKENDIVNIYLILTITNESAMKR